MPGENVSFEAFGQNHNDKHALEAVGAHLTELHARLQSERQSLIIGVERSDEDVQIGPKAIINLHNQGVVQAYCDAMRAQGAEPEPGGFINAHLKDLRWSPTTELPFGRTVDSKEGTDVFELAQMAAFFNANLAVSKADNNVGRGPSHVEEARILQWAMENDVRVIGLDPLSDVQKRHRLQRPNGRINNGALKEVEFERVQGMGSKAATVMEDLSGRGGGCLVAINMGAAHLGSLEVALRDGLRTRGLEKAEVQMRVPVSTESLDVNETAQQKMESHLRTSVNDMRAPLHQLERNLASLEEGRREAEMTLAERKVALTHLDKLPVDDTALRNLIKTEPERVAEILNEGLTQKHSKIKAGTIQKLGGTLDSNLESSAHDLLRECLKSRVTEMEEALAEHVSDVKTAMTELDSFREANRTTVDFAQRVEDRINEKPEGIFTPLIQGLDGRYDLSVLDPGKHQTVGESLGRPSSSAPVQHAHEQEIGPSDHSTRAQLRRSGSFTKPGGDSTTTQGPTPSKVVHSM